MTATLEVKSDFSIFEAEPELAYFDSASTCLVPKVAVDATTEFLKNTVASARRGAHHLTVNASGMVEDVRKSLADYFQTDRSQVSFQKSIPSAVASLAYGLDWRASKRKKLVIAQSEEHSVMVALLRAAQVLKLEVQMVPVNQEGGKTLEGYPLLASGTSGQLSCVAAVTPGLLEDIIDEIDEGIQRMRRHYGW